MIKYIPILLIVPFNAFGFVCKQTSILREDEFLYVCGEGKSFSKTSAEKLAYQNAMDTLETHCKYSVDCKDKEYSITPMRVKCRQVGIGYHCNRMLEVELISRYITEQELKLSLLSSLVLNQDTSFSMPELDFSAMIQNQIGRYSFLLTVGYRFSTIKTKAKGEYYLDYEYIEEIDYKGLSYGLGLGFETDKIELNVLRIMSNQSRSPDDDFGVVYSDIVDLPSTFKSSENRVILYKKVDESNSFGVSASDYSNTLGVTSNSMGFHFKYEF